MLAKPINFILVYVVTVFNLLFIFLPFVSLLIPFLKINNNTLILQSNIFEKFIILSWLMLFVISAAMIFYLFIDFLFGFSVRSSLKDCLRYEKNKDYDFLTNIFNQVKDKFAQRSVKLYVKNSDEINAYAVSSLGSKAIIITRGLIDHYLKNSQDSKSFLNSIRSIIGHEMSHLINKDFLPTFLIIVNQKITNFISKILHFIFHNIVKYIRFLSFEGGYISMFILNIYRTLNFLITFFNRFVVYGIYNFLRRFVSRSIEYRCDNQSARAFGGSNMAVALSYLGDGGYFTLFSTHPRTKSRIQRVTNIKIEDGIIRPKFIDDVANFLSLIFLLAICLYFSKQAKIDILVREILKDHQLIYAKFSYIINLIKKIY